MLISPFEVNIIAKPLVSYKNQKRLTGLFDHSRMVASDKIVRRILNDLVLETEICDCNFDKYLSKKIY